MAEEGLEAIKQRRGDSPLLAFLTHGSKEEYRLACTSIRDIGFDPQHADLFAELVRITRPTLEVESVSQTRQEVQTQQDASSAGLMSWQDGEWKPAPQHLLGGVKLTSFEGTTCAVRYRYRGQEYGFLARPSGSWMDVASVLQAFNGFMRQIGREERAFRLAEGPGSNGEFPFFLCAREAAFRQVAAKVYIPLAPEGKGTC
jgi:hypothetical protein